MTTPRHLLPSALCLAAALALPSFAAAQASGDGRLGPRVFNGTALDESLSALNTFLSDRYAHDDLMAALSAPAPVDFTTTAVAVADFPHYATGESAGGLTGAVNSGSALDVHLAAFNDDLSSKGDSLFIRIARAAGGTSVDMREAGGLPPLPGDVLSFGPVVQDDSTLDTNLDVLSDHIVEHALRDQQLTGDGSVTGLSFDRYGDALRLF